MCGSDGSGTQATAIPTYRPGDPSPSSSPRGLSALSIVVRLPLIPGTLSMAGTRTSCERIGVFCMGQKRKSRPPTRVPY